MPSRNEPALRRLVVGAGALVMAALLAACGSDPPPSANPTAAWSSVTHAHSARFVVSMTSNGLPAMPLGPATNLQALVDHLSASVLVMSTNGALLSDRQAMLASKVDLSFSGRPLAEAIATPPARVDVSIDRGQLGALPLQLSGASAAAVQDLADGQWYELPAGAGGPVGSRHAVVVAGRDLYRAVLAIAATFSRQSRFTSDPSTAHSQVGSPTVAVLRATGPVSRLLAAAAPEVAAAASSLGHPIPADDLAIAGTLGGSYTASLYVSAASVLNALVVALTIGGVGATFTVGITHPKERITAPTGAIPLPASAVRALGS